MNRLEELKKIRKDITKDYAGREIEITDLDKLYKEEQDVLFVKVKEIREETKDTKSFILVPDIEKGTTSLEAFKAGQYISVKMFIDEVYVTRAYSLSSSPKDALREYRITIKRVENGLVSNIMLNEIKVGDGLTISRPMGEFGYNKIRDEKDVIAIAGGSGITPFMAMALAIRDGIDDYNLTVFYSVRTKEDIIFKKEIEEINKKCKKVKFIITLTREEQEGYLHGHLSKYMIEPYIKEFNTVFMCGPKEIYKTMNEILSEFNIPKKSVHYESFFVEYKPSEVAEYDLKVIMKNDFVITKCRSDETLLVSMERAGIKAPSMCRVGICGFCRSILLDGKIKMIGNNMKKAETLNDYFHPCVTYPESDIVIRLDI